VGGLTATTNATAPIRHRLPDFFENFPGFGRGSASTHGGRGISTMVGAAALLYWSKIVTPRWVRESAEA
jgi:hypothetical protein